MNQFTRWQALLSVLIKLVRQRILSFVYLDIFRKILKSFTHYTCGLLLSVTILMCKPALAQQPDYHAQIIMREGLMDPGQVLEIMRDDKGFLWLLSATRVQKFDGKGFLSFSFNGRCTSIQQDEDGVIWMATRQDIYRFRNDYSGFEKLPEYASEKNKYLKLISGPGKKIYLLTANSISQWESSRNKFDSLHIPVFNASGSFPFLKYYGNYLFYKKSNNSLARYNVITKALDSVVITDANYVTPLNGDSAWVREDIGGSVIVSFKTKKVTPITTAQFEEKFNDSRFMVLNGFNDTVKHGYFVTLNDKGYYLYTPATGKFKKVKIFYNGLLLTGTPPVNGFFQEGNGNVWFRHELGLVLLKPYYEGFGLLRGSSASNNPAWDNDIRCFAEDEKGNIWFGTASGFSKWNKQTGQVQSWLPKFEADNYLNYGSVRSIGFSNGKIIIGQSEKGFWIFDPVKQTFQRPHFASDSMQQKFNDEFNSNMVRLRNGNFLIFSNNCWLLEKGAFNIRLLKFTGPLSRFKYAYEDNAGRIWLTGQQGIFAADSNWNKLYSYSDDPELNSWCNAVVQTDSVTFWVAAKGLHELKLKPGGKIDYRLIFPELNKIHFSNLFKDSAGHIWMSSQEGIYRYIPGRNVMEKYNKSDNVQYYSIVRSNSIRGSDGTVYFGSTNGINYFVPEKFSLHNETLQVQLKNVTVNQDDSSYLSGRFQKRLSYRENAFVFDFIATYLYNADKVQYRYMLKGADKDWVQLGNNTSVRFTSLQPGAYSFIAAASLNGRDWYEMKQPFSFSIAPPFWRTAAFIILAALLFAGGIGWFIFSLQQKIKIEKTVNEFATSLYGQNTTDDIFWETAKNCIDKLGFVDCVLYQKDEHREVLIQKAAYGPKNPFRREILNVMEIPVGKGIVGSAAKTGKPVIVSDTAKDARYIVDDEKRMSEMAVPVIIDGETFAVIDSEHPQKNFYKPFHVKVLKRVAANCGERIAKHLTEERLRAKIARDLHDEMGSTLTSINIISTVAMEEKPEEEKLKGYFQKIKDHSGRMMESMSDMVWAVNPVNDNFEKVLLRMKEFAAEILEPARINYYFTQEGSPADIPLNLEQRKNIYMIFKEAVNNAVKYSRATEININVQQQAGKLKMTITDNGLGFDTSITTSGNGLKNMQGRAADMGASIKLDSIKGTGTSVLVELPIT